MDSSAEIESEVKSGEKRSVAEDGGGGGGPVRKKVKKENLVSDMRKVAEMVLVLAAMGKMRGGRVPTLVEKEIMSAARNKLAEVCQFFAPKDVFPRDVFGGIIEDLGLNKVKEQRLGFRPPKISISEKLLFSKRKMEKTDDFSQPSVPNSSRRQHGISAGAVESRGPSPAVRGFPSDKSGHTPIPAGSFQPASPLVHAVGINSTSSSYQLPTSEVRPVVSGGLTPNHPVKDSTSAALPRVDRSQFRLDGRPNGSHQSQLQANSSGDHLIGKTPTWPVQSQSLQSAKIALDTKVQTQSAFKFEGAADAKIGVASQVSSSKPFISQTIPVNPQSVHQNFQGMNPAQAPLLKHTHSDISKIVQKFLHPRTSERPDWTPPSRDYMNKPLTCQVCKFVVNDVDSVLVCDACEKGFHLKCLQISNPKGVPRAEWHCGKCLQLSNGKPLPPKYGRVMRNINAPKAPSNTALQSSSEKKVGSLNENVNQQKITANGNSALHSTAAASMVNSHPTSVSKIASASEMLGNTIAGRGTIDEKASLGACSSEVTETSMPTVSPCGPPAKRKYEEMQLESEPQHSANPEAAHNVSVLSRSVVKQDGSHHRARLPNDVVLAKHDPGNHTKDNHLKESSAGESLCSKTLESSRGCQETVRANPAEASTTGAGHIEPQRLLPHHVHSVDWIGNIVRADDDKTFFHSCHINGFVYKLQDHVLIRFNNDRLIPSKLQAMWEDRKNKTKWVTVNRCYFPGDLPVAVGRPCGLESCEVYESTFGCTLMAGLIQGPCEVLPPGRFALEKDRRASLRTVQNANLQPLYLCKWIYDETKGLFRDVSC